MSVERDPWDYLIMDEPVPPELADDPEFAESYARAQADADLLRRGLTSLAATSALPPDPDAAPAVETSGAAGSGARADLADSADSVRDSAEPASVSPGDRWTRPKRWLIGLAAAACLASIGGGGWIVGSGLNGSGASETTASDSSTEGGSSAQGKPAEPFDPQDHMLKAPRADASIESVIACAKTVAVGSVETVRPSSDDRLRVEISVTRTLRGEQPADDTIRFLVDASSEWRVGRAVLVAVPTGPTVEPYVVWPDRDPTLADRVETEAQRTDDQTC